MACLQIKPVKPTPTENTVFALPRILQMLVAALACAIAIAGDTRAATELHSPQEQVVAWSQASSSTEVATSSSSADSSAAADDSLLSTFFGGYALPVDLSVVLIGLFAMKQIRTRREKRRVAQQWSPRATPQPKKDQLPPATRNQVAPLKQRPLADSRSTVQELESPLQVQQQTASVYGAYRIDQEVGKLVLGKPHRIDVMASRAVEDRRAIEASLLKSLTASDTDENGRRRARRALEEYGFVARESAQLLLGRDAWERSAAARMLGEIGSPASLQFLIEALHDQDSVVRNQVVSSLGALKLPAAIGALLDIARRHPEIPAPLLSEALSACSVDSQGFLDLPVSQPALLSDGGPTLESVEQEMVAVFEDLPQGAEDAAFADALAQADNPDATMRARVAQQLGTHAVQSSVSALASMAMSDPEPAVRAAAVASLGCLDHESVFSAVLIALADDSREVQAAAARALTSLHFDRADAYLRVMDTADSQPLRNVARACIKTGIAAQAVGRLASEDRRQAYEAFSLFSLLARANETDPIIEAIEKHPDNAARVCAVRVLNVAGRPEVVPELREIAASEGMPENVRTAILEVLYKLDQEASEPDLAVSDNDAANVA